jgi:predicted RNase H-like HicB family nuclease
MKADITISLKLEVEIDYSEDNQTWQVSSPEMPGFSAFGSSRDQALAEAELAAELWFESVLEGGIFKRSSDTAYPSSNRNE